MLRSAAIFIAAFIAMELAYNALRDTIVSELLIDRITVSSSAAILDWLDHSVSVTAESNRILSPDVTLRVKVGCEGTETLLLLLAAIIAIPISWRHKLPAIVIGSLLVYGLNQIRIISLFYALKHNKPLFDALHSYIAPLLIVVIVGLCFSLWLSVVDRNDDANHPSC